MGSFLDKPKTDTEPEIVTGNGLTAALVSMQGWRITQEDSHVMQMGVPGHDTTSWFGVFDGHGGSLIAIEAAKRLLGHVDLSSIEPEKLKVALRTGFLACDAEMRKMEAVQRGDDHSGCTAVTVMVTPDHIICANAGDSRAILITGNKAKALSDDHKPNNEAETARIVKAGGTVHMRRVNGDLAVSRALGDYVYKNSHQLPAEAQQVSPEPDFVVHDRDAAADQFVLIACDGIWDVMSNEEAAEYVLAKIEAGVSDLGELADEMVRHCLHLGSRDNMSIVLVGLPGAPTATAEAKAAYAAAKAAKAAAAASAAAGAEGGATDEDGDIKA